MQTKTTYKGYINGIFGVYCGFKPDELEVTEEVLVYYPDKDKVFTKNGRKYSAVILKENEDISDYEEIEKQSYDRADT